MERLQKALASAGAGSRRSCEELISAGRVTVNGVPVTLGTKVDPLLDRVTVDGRPVDLRPRRPVCIIMYKPRGYVTTRRDPHGRRTVMDLVREDIPGLHPVGRLDYDSEGLLLLTNDGGITYRLTHPKHEVDKTYEVSVEGVPGGSVLDRLRTGVRLQEGTTAPARAGILRTSENRAVVKISIHQGWNRQVRRMFEAVGHPVVRLKRTAYGPLRLGRLKPGQYRFLSDEEMDSLRAPGQGPGRALPGGRGRERNWSRST
ncbi:MAG: rRNA pseudouridine synthase [Firmicutes bacterium]|nr:rRNA pseudouridine synthase [Bacillota bacterium]